MPWRETGKVIGTVGDDNVKVQDASGRVITMPKSYFEKETASSPSSSSPTLPSSSSSSLYSPVDNVVGNIVSNINSRLGQGVYHPYNEETGVTPHWSFVDEQTGKTINVTDPGRQNYNDAQQRANQYLTGQVYSAAYPDDGKGYAYTDKYGFSHVGSLAAAKTYGVPNSIREYSGSFSGGYARDNEGNHIMVNTPGAVPYGNQRETQQRQDYLDNDRQTGAVYNAPAEKKAVTGIKYNPLQNTFADRDKSGARIGVQDSGKLNAVSRYLSKNMWQ